MAYGNGQSDESVLPKSKSVVDEFYTGSLGNKKTNGTTAPKSVVDEFYTGKLKKSSDDSFITNLGEGIEMGSKQLWAGAKYAVADVGQMFTDDDVWAHEIKNWAKDYVASAPQADDSVGQFLGSLVPSALPSALAIGSAFASGGATLPAVAGWAAAGGLGLASAGQGMMDYDSYKESIGEVGDPTSRAAVGLAYGVAEFAMEKLALGQYTKNFSKHILRGNADIAEKAGKELIAKYAKGTKTTVSKLLKNIGMGSSIEGVQESLTELAQNITDNIYRESEDMYDWGTIANNMKHAAIGGAIMGTGLGALSYKAQDVTHNRRRNEQGFVRIAEFNGEGVEVLGQNKEKTKVSIMYPDGNVSDVAPDLVKSQANITPNQFRNLLKGKTDETNAVENSRIEMDRQTRSQFDDGFAKTFTPHIQEGNTLKMGHVNQVPIVISKQADQKVSPGGVYVAEVVMDEVGMPVATGNLTLMAEKDIDGIMEMPVEEWRANMLGPRLANIPDSSLPAPVIGEPVQHPTGNGSIIAYDPELGEATIEVVRKVGKGENDVERDNHQVSRAELDQYRIFENKSAEKAGKDADTFAKEFDEAGNPIEVEDTETAPIEEKSLDLEVESMDEPLSAVPVGKGVYEVQGKKIKEAQKLALEVQDNYPNLGVEVVDKTDKNDPTAKANYVVQIKTKKDDTKSNDSNIPSNESSGTDTGKSKGIEGKEEISGQKGDIQPVSTPDIQKPEGGKAIPVEGGERSTSKQSEGGKKGNEDAGKKSVESGSEQSVSPRAEKEVALRDDRNKDNYDQTTDAKIDRGEIQVLDERRADKHAKRKNDPNKTQTNDKYGSRDSSDGSDSKNQVSDDTKKEAVNNSGDDNPSASDKSSILPTRSSSNEREYARKLSSNDATKRGDNTKSVSKSDNQKPRHYNQLNKTEQSSVQKIVGDYINERESRSDLSNKERILTEYSPSTRSEDFGRVNDKNNVTHSIAKSYFRNDSLGLDQQAKEINDQFFDGEDVMQPSDIADFMVRFPNGPDMVGNPARALNKQYQDITGKSLNIRTAKALAEKHNTTEKEINNTANEVDKLEFLLPNGETDWVLLNEAIKSDPDVFKKLGITSIDEQNHLSSLAQDYANNPDQIDTSPIGESGSTSKIEGVSEELPPFQKVVSESIKQDPRLEGTDETNIASEFVTPFVPKNKPLIEKEVAKFKKRFPKAPPVKVLEGYLDLQLMFPQTPFEDIYSRNAFFNPQDGNVYMIASASRFSDPKMIEQTLLHEVVGHYGIRKALDYVGKDGGKKFNAFMDKVANEYNGDSAFKMVSESYVLGKTFENLTTSEKRLVAEEYIAHVSETNTNQTLIDQIVDWFKEVLGIQTDMSGDMIRDIIANGRRMVKVGDNMVSREPLLPSNKIAKDDTRFQKEITTFEVDEDNQSESERVSKREFEERYQKPFKSAASNIRSNSSTAGTQQQRIESENFAALKYAKDNNLWHDDLYTFGEHLPGAGVENTLAIDKEGGYVYKSNNLMLNEGSVSKLMERMLAHNAIFPETAYELVGFTGIDNGGNRAPVIEPIIKQKYVHEANQATQEEIDSYMEKAGFIQDDDTWIKGDVEVGDLSPRNVLSKDGVIYVIDPFIGTISGQNDVRFQKESPIFEDYENESRDSQIRGGALQKAARDNFKNAYDYIGRGVSSVEANEQIAKQHQNAKEYAKANGLWLNSLSDLGTPTDFGGMENKIAINTEKGEIYKSNNLFVHKGSILSHINYIQRHNFLSPITGYELAGFHEVMKNGQPWIKPVVKQTLIRGEGVRQATQDEIDAGMKKRGYYSNNRKSFSYDNGSFEVSDLKPANVLFKDGEIFIVDNITKKFNAEDVRFQRDPNDVQTGKPFNFRYLKNKDVSPNFGERFGQHIEPAGDFVSEISPKAKTPDWGNFEHGEVSINNPLVFEVTNEDLFSWKRELSKMYGGKVNKALSQAIIADGYDGIITKDKERGYTGEIVLLGGQRSPMRFQKSPPTESPEFQKWFGDSKVVDSEGNPLVMYHGTDAEFNVFDSEKGKKWAKKVGFWFTDQKDFSELFGENVMPVYLSVQNPIVITQDTFNKWREKHFDNESFWKGKKNEWIANGNDGLIIIGKEEKFAGELMPATSIFAAFSPTQIKSTTNQGTFDPQNPDIRFQKEPVDPNYSKWKRSNVTYRGISSNTLTNPNNAGASLGQGLYTAPSSNKEMSKEYGQVYFVVNGRPKNPIKFNSVNEFQIWEQNLMYKELGYSRKSEFDKATSINEEIQKKGYDGVEIKGREIVNYNPIDVKYFNTEEQVRRYHEDISNQSNESPRFQKETKDNFYSNSLMAIRNVNQGKATGDQWKAMLLKNGSSQSELDWIGVDDFLKDNPKPTKEEVYEFIKGNKVETHKVPQGILMDANGELAFVETPQSKHKLNDKFLKALIQHSVENGLSPVYSSNDDLVMSLDKNVEINDGLFEITPLIRQKAINQGLPMFQKEAPLQYTREGILGKVDRQLFFWQDRYRYLKLLQDFKSKSGREITDDMNAYDKETTSHGKINEEQEKFKESHVNPLDKTLKALKSQDISYDEVGRYLQAKHISVDQVEKGGIPIDEAQKIVEDFENRASKDNLDKLTHDVAKVRDYVLDKKLEYGMLSKARYDLLKGQFKFYVPLRGFADLEDSDKTFFTKDYKRKGRESEAANPIPYMMTDAQTVVVKGEQNRVKQALLDFVRANPDSRHYSIRNAWYLVNKKTGDVTAKYSTPTPEEFSLNDVSRSEPLPETMTMEQYKDFRRSSTYEQDALSVMVDGKKFFIEFTDDNISKVFKNQGIDKMPKKLQWMADGVAYLRKAYTQYSPEFGPRNFIRDLSTGMINIRNDFGTETSAQVLRNINFKTVWKGIVKRDFSGKNGAILQEFIEAGGLTGYSDLKDVSQVHREWERQIEGIGKEIKSIRDAKDAIKQTKGFKYTLGAMDDINRMLENTMRYATYKTLRDKGISAQKAAVYAKDVTVNFNRKGSESGWLGSLYLFANASIQGNERLLRPLFGEDKVIRNRAITTAVTLPALYMAIAMMNEIVGGDDEDGESHYSKLSEYDKTHNLIFPNPLADEDADSPSRFFRIPLPYGYNVFFAWPNSILDWASGKETAGSAMLKTVAMGMESFSPLGSPQFDSDLTVEGKIGSYIMPTIGKIPLEVELNTNFMGLPIYKEQSPYDTPRPDSEMYFNSVNPVFKEIAKTLNKASGGDRQQSGTIDINPEVMEHYVSGYSGGLGKFLVNSMATLMNISRDGKETFTTDKIKSVPFVRNYVTSPSPYMNRIDFFDQAREIEAKEDILNRYKKEGNKEKIKEYRNENLPYLRLTNLSNNFRKQIKKLEDMRLRYEASGDEDLVANVEKKQQELYKKFNKEYKQSIGGKPNDLMTLLGLK
jgi:hypothetical protein